MSGRTGPKHAPDGTGEHPPAGGPLAFTFGSWFTWTALGVAFPLLGLALVAAARPLAQGVYESYPVLAATHLATLGWGTMTIMGAAAQMAPVLLGARVRAERLIPWMFALFALSVLLLVAGLAARRLAMAVAGGIGANVAAWMFLAVMGSTVAAAGSRATVLSPHIPAALTCFALVLLWGTLLAANLRWGMWPGLLLGHRGLLVHLVLGLGGWFGLMIVGTFYRLVPLVHGARVASAVRGWGILSLGLLAIGAALAGVVWGEGSAFRIGADAGAAALLLFGWEVLHILARRRSREPDLNVSHWYAVVGYSAALALAGAGWSVGWIRSVPPDRLGECVVVVYLLGWVTQAIVGQLYKVTPFLMWYYRATIPDVLAIPRQPAPYHPLPGRIVLWMSNIGVVLLTAGIWAGAAATAQAGAGCVAAAALVLAYMLAYRWVPPAMTGALVFEWRRRIS